MCECGSATGTRKLTDQQDFTAVISMLDFYGVDRSDRRSSCADRRPFRHCYHKAPSLRLRWQRLELVLRSRGVEYLILAGITSGVVLPTLRQAADLDYRITVLADGCGDGDELVHQMLLEHVFPARANVTNIEDWAADVSR